MTTNQAQDPASERWLVLRRDGKKVVLIGREHNWTVFECENAEIAGCIVRELKAWAKQEHDKDYFESLCRS